MKASEILNRLSAWFEHAGTASMELPHGWFGRPYDAMHQLTWSTSRDEKLFLELDGQVHLILADVDTVEEEPAQFTLECRHAVLDRRDYGSSGRRWAEVFSDGGVVRFHASGV
jgi:hypothetical protein